MERRVRFAIPGDLATPTGGYGYDRRLIAELRALGWTVDVVALPAGYPLPTAAEQAAARAAFAAIPDDATVIVDGLAFGAMAEIARDEASRVRLVALVHHPLADEAGQGAAEMERFMRSERAALSFARAVVCTSAATARRLRAGFGVAVERITVAPPGTDPRPRAAMRGNPPRLIALGTLVPRKGHDVLIAALGSVADLPWTARFVGAEDRDAGWAEALRRQVAEAGLDERIVFAGAVTDAGAELAAADIFALPSRHEGYGMAFAEALAHGLPVVACQAGAVPDLVPQAAGALVPADDPAALAAALRRLIADTEARRRASDAAWAAGQALPGWRDTARIVSDLLERVAR